MKVTWDGSHRVPVPQDEAQQLEEARQQLSLQEKTLSPAARARMLRNVLASAQPAKHSPRWALGFALAGAALVIIGVVGVGLRVFLDAPAVPPRPYLVSGQIVLSSGALVPIGSDLPLLHPLATHEGAVLDLGVALVTADQKSEMSLGQADGSRAESVSRGEGSWPRSASSSRARAFR